MAARKATYKVGRLLSHHSGEYARGDFLWFHPRPQSPSDWADLSARVNWYVPHCSVPLYAGEGMVPAFSAADAPHMDPALVRDPGWCESRPNGRAEHVFWKMSFLELPRFLRHSRKAEIADHTWFWLSDRGWTRVLARYGPSLPSTTAAWQSLAGLRRPGTNVLVLATGPSARLVDPQKVTADFTVTCNSAVRDKALMAALKPKVICFADPVFHYGPSRYAAAFRQDLYDLLDDSPDTIVATSDHFAAILHAHRPDLAERTVVTHPDSRSPWRVPGADDTTVFQTGNVLTGLMMPIAASFGSTLQIAGCDGRQPSESYFWKHNTKTQYSDEMMQTAFDAHPAFFRDVSFTDYYDRHCEELEELATALEARGQRILPITPSWIPALRRRGAPDFG